jgi:hypothetical protein
MSTVLGDKPKAHIVEVEEDNINIFDVGASMKKYLCTLVTRYFFFILELIYPFI